MSKSISVTRRGGTGGDTTIITQDLDLDNLSLLKIIELKAFNLFDETLFPYDADTNSRIMEYRHRGDTALLFSQTLFRNTEGKLTHSEFRLADGTFLLRKDLTKPANGNKVLRITI